MQELIDVIRAATTSGATAEQKAAGVQACRAIIAALDTEPGKPLEIPGMPAQSPLAGIKLDQLLDMMIAKLTMVANARDTTVAAPAVAAPPPNGLRVPTPMATPRAITPANRSANAVPATKLAQALTRKA